MSEVSESGSVIDEREIPAGSGLVMSDSDMTGLATRTGQLLNCKTDMFNYSKEELQPTQFEKKLEFVLIQDSGRVLDQYSTAGHQGVPRCSPSQI